MAIYTCVNETFEDVIMENAPAYKFFDMFVYDEYMPGYVWTGKAYDMLDFYPLEIIDYIDDTKGEMYFLRTAQEMER